ncbi:MAG: hypothetical protein AB7O62_06735 [Pirellulales bacterium]
MPRNQQPAGSCPQCNQATQVCFYNHFEKGDQRIDSWEHKCTNCGFRDTRAFRSEDPDPPPDPTICPMCDRKK